MAEVELRNASMVCSICILTAEKKREMICCSYSQCICLRNNDTARQRDRIPHIIQTNYVH